MLERMTALKLPLESQLISNRRYILNIQPLPQQAVYLSLPVWQQEPRPVVLVSRSPSLFDAIAFVVKLKLMLKGVQLLLATPCGFAAPYIW
jgi:hypothetical protein